MSNVVLTIGGRKFTVACADGEEAHIGKLGRMIDERLSALGDTAGQNEVRMLLYAALVLADDLHEAQNASTASPSGDFLPSGAARRLENIALQMENLAARLEGRDSSA